jgi:hypothetical protein
MRFPTGRTTPGGAKREKQQPPRIRYVEENEAVVRKRIVSVLLICILLLAGCAARQPISDPVLAREYKQDLYDCRKYAADQSWVPKRSGEANWGAVIGDIVSIALNHGYTAGGGNMTYLGLDVQRDYLRHCMIRRGWNVTW